MSLCGDLCLVPAGDFQEEEDHEESLFSSSRLFIHLFIYSFIIDENSISPFIISFNI